ncbi:MAG TPA: amino acid permease [Caulobacteraceae bacterium]|nr:amino acid permease [Caulobacteraceae bacterium]
MAFWNRRRSVEEAGAHEGGAQLKRTLGWPHLVALGVGAIVGTGIYTLTGVGVDKAGPGIIIAFAIVGVICTCVALAYAELATMMPGSGGAYTYSYATLGELVAWIVGWSLILEYSLVVSAVAVGWSAYAVGFLNGLGIDLPAAVASGPHAGGLFNLPAVFIIAVVSGLLLLGTRESATVNALLVAVKIAALVLFVAVALPHFDAANFQPLMPFGFEKSDQGGVERGVMAAAAIVFFAFYGFDAISTAAEETKNPGRDLTIGILGSMVLCTILYMLVAAAAVGSMPFGRFAASEEPLADILRLLNQDGVAQWVAAAVVIGVPTVILAFLYGQTRIFFVMARDGLLPQGLSKVNPKTGVPVAITLFTAIVVSALAGVFRLDEIAALANAGTLAAFIAVGVCLMVLRITQAKRVRVFRTPLWPVVGVVTVAGCAWLFSSLPERTQVWFLIWNAIGLVLYFAYGAWNSRLAKRS